MNHFRPGDHILLREIWRGRVWTARPVILVEDSPQLVALYIANGSTWKRPFNIDGMPKRIPAGDWQLRDDLWTNDVLRISLPGERFSVLPIHDEQSRLRFWYLNIETPLRRTGLGFDYMDQTLDIIVSPDLREWRWKDEEELAQAVELGVYTAEQAEDIRAAGEQALTRFMARQAPLDREWDRWRAPPEWAAPYLPKDWDVVK